MTTTRLLGVLTAVHGRHALARAMLRAIPSSPPGWRTIVVVALGAEDRHALEDIFHFGRQDPALLPIVTENSPLTFKWQRGLEQLRKIGCEALDAVCIMGSDDFASQDYWSAALKRIAGGEKRPFGIRWCYMLNAETGQMGKFPMGDPRRAVGCGRFYPSSALDLVDWKLWTVAREKGLDGASESRLAEVGLTLDAVELPGFLVDVKTFESMHGWNEFVRWGESDLCRFEEILPKEKTVQILEDAGLREYLQGVANV